MNSGQYKVEAQVNEKGSNQFVPVVTSYTPDFQSAVIVQTALEKHLPGLLAVSQGSVSVHREVRVKVRPVLPGDGVMFRSPNEVSETQRAA